MHARSVDEIRGTLLHAFGSIILKRIDFGEQIEHIKKLTENQENSDLLVKFLCGKTTEELTENKNLFKADELLEVLKHLNDTERLNADNLNATIKDFDSLFWAIIEAPRTEENKEAYSKVMKLLSGVKGLDYNQKDKNGISALEKVINAENDELLDIMSDIPNKLNYYPELDWAFEGIQNPEFKEKVKHLNLRFTDLEQATKLCSLKAFDRVKSQLNSPLCNKDTVIRQLFDILKELKGTVEPPDVYAYHLLDEFGAYLSRDLYNEMATWQINARIKRTI